MLDTFYLIGLTLILLLILWSRHRHNRTNNDKLKVLVDNRTKDLVEANAAKDLFLANIGHEVSNPLNGIVGIAQSIKTETLDPDTKHKLELLSHCANHVSALLDDVLNLSNAHTGTMAIDSKPFAISEVTTLLKALTLAESEKYHARIEITVSSEIPKRLIGDARRICQILQNFISNSLKYSNSSEVRVKAWCEKQNSDTLNLFFAVADDGVGISTEEQAKLFVPFQRGSKARTANTPGTGLGLALCKTLAEKMGGQVWVQSEPDKGACFYFSAPLRAEIGPAETWSTHLQPNEVNLKKALVVDDEEYNRIAMCGLLEALGLSVQCASKDHEALALAAANDFDLVTLDYSIPGMNGPAIAQAIRATPSASSRALILATTAFNTNEIHDECMAAGMNGFLSKPITLECLRHALNNLKAHSPISASLSSPQPVDQLANLRILAGKKNVPITEELTLFFSEFELELKQLAIALQAENVTRLKYHTHLLRGRCSFIREQSFETTLRKIEESASGNNWPDAQLAAVSLQKLTGNLRVRFFSETPTVQPA